jgi:hypothetical protein
MLPRTPEASQQRTRLAWRALFLACTVVSVAPLYAARHLPFTDLPEHVAAMSTLRHWLDPAWPDSGIYTLSTRGSPYLAYHVIGALLTAVTGDALAANVLLLTAVGLAIPLATRSLLRAAGGDERLALLSCTTLWCRPLALGFLPFLAAVPVTLFALGLVVRQAAAPTRRRGVAIALVLLPVFYLHMDPFVLVVVVALVLHLVPLGPRADESLERRIVRLPVRVAWLGPSALAMGVWIARARADGGAAFMGQGAVHFVRLGQLVDEFPAWAHGIWRGPVGETAGFLQWVIVLVLGAQMRVPETAGARGLAARLVPFACALALFALMPSQVGITSMLNVRLAVFLLPCLLVVLRPDPGRTTAAALMAAAIVTFAVAADAAIQIRGAERDEVAGIDELLAEVPAGARLLTLDFAPRSPHVAVAPWIHLGALHRLRGGGVASVSFAELPHWPIQFRPEWLPPTVVGRSLEWEPCRFGNTTDGRYYDHLLVHGRDDPFRGEPPAGPRWTRVDVRGAWAVYAKVDGPEVPAEGADRGLCGGLLGR